MKRGTVIGGLVVGALGLGGLTAWRVADALTRRTDAGAQTEGAAAVPVEVYAAATRDLVEVVQVAGTIRARHEADVVADVPGRVQAVLVDVGEAVTRGQPLARLESTELALQVRQAEAAVAMARAGQVTAARDFEAAEAVAKAGGLTESQRVAAHARLATADAQVMQAEAALGLARERLSDATLRSPIAGVVTRRLTDVGRMVNPGAPAFSVQDLSELELVLAVDEHTAPRLVAGAAVPVSSDHTGAEITGTIRTVAPALDPQSRKGEVIVSLPAVPGLLPQGTATARLELGRLTGAVAVPSRAILEADGSSYVYVADGGTAHRTAVRPGLRDGEWVEAAGLPAGAAVIVTGQSYLTDGAAVTVREPS